MSYLVVPEIKAYKRQVIGGSQEYKNVLFLIHLAASHGAPVHILGQAGTGKSMAARLIHNLSGDGEFMVANVHGQSKWPPNGWGTEGTMVFESVNAAPEHYMDHLAEATVLRGPTRAFLVSRYAAEVYKTPSPHAYNLLSTLPSMAIKMPSLQDRMEDIPALALYLIAKSNKSRPKTAWIRYVEEEALNIMARQKWQGNITELERFIAKLLPDPTRTLHVRNLPLKETPDVDLTPTHGTIAEMEKALISRTLVANNNVLYKTAKALGVTVVTLKGKMKRYGLR